MQLNILALKNSFANHMLVDTVFWSAIVFFVTGTTISDANTGLLALSVFLLVSILLYFRKDAQLVKPFLYLTVLFLFMKATDTYDEDHLAPLAGFVVDMPVKFVAGILLGLQFTYTLNNRSYKQARRAFLGCVIAASFVLLTVKLAFSITIFSLLLPVMFIVATFFLLPEFVRRSRFES